MTPALEERDFFAARAGELEPWLAHLHGNRFARIVAIKGDPGVVEQEGGQPFFGADGDALESALERLGFEGNEWCGIAADLPKSGVLSAGEVRLLIEIIDPLIVLALDRSAACLVQKGYGAELLPDIPEPGRKTRLLGRTFVVIDGFEAALVSEPLDGGEAKRRVWKELKVLQKEV